MFLALPLVPEAMPGAYIDRATWLGGTNVMGSLQMRT